MCKAPKVDSVTFRDENAKPSGPRRSRRGDASVLEGLPVAETSAPPVPSDHIMGFDGSFPGRSLAAIFAAGNPSYVEGFGPPLPGFVQAPFGDLDALRELVGPTTAAIIIEPVQGEGGARSWPDADLRAMRQL